jgi:aspartate carbamoyltransferase catalytic subunit
LKDVTGDVRVQRERMAGGFFPSAREFFWFYGLDEDKLRHAKPGALVMHPGPMNRGVEIDSSVADNAAVSLIETQVRMGVAVRMAVLEALAENGSNEETS